MGNVVRRASRHRPQPSHPRPRRALRRDPARRTALRRASERGRGSICAAQANKTTSPAASLPAPYGAGRAATSTARAKTSTRHSKSPSAGRCGCIWRTLIPIARGCSGFSRTGPRPTPGSRRATISMRREGSSMNAATDGGARSSRTPRRHGSGSTGLLRPARRVLSAGGHFPPGQRRHRERQAKRIVGLRRWPLDRRVAALLAMTD